MIALERIAEFLRKRRFHDARGGCLSLLQKDRKHGQAWAYLGQAMVGLKQGEMASKCFDRASLLDPFAPWITTALTDAQQTETGKPDHDILRLLTVPPRTVSATVLTRDNERTIEQCLRLLKDAVDEIIVVDTGSKDATIEIIQSLGIAVHSFLWIDDFSAARNYAMSLASGDWIIAVDSDERLYTEDVDAIRTIAGLFDEQPYLIKVLQMNEVDKNIEPFQVGRMVNRHQGFHWRGRIHENLYPQQGEVVPSLAVRIRLLHDGYDPTKVNREDKIQRNINLLHLEIKDRPEQAGPYYFLARELMMAKHYEDTIPYLQKANELADRHHPMLPDIRKLQLDVHNALGHTQEAETYIKQLTEELPDYPDGWFWLGMQQLNRADSDMNEIHHYILRSKQLASLYRGQSQFDSTLATWKADYVLAVIAEQRGHTDEARNFYRTALQHHPQLQGAREALVRLGRQ